MHALRNQFSPCHARVDDSFAGADIQSRKNRAAAVWEFCPFTRFTAEEIENGPNQVGMTEERVCTPESEEASPSEFPAFTRAGRDLNDAASFA